MHCTSFLRGDNACNWYMLGTRYALVYRHMSLPSISPDGLLIIVFTMRTRPTLCNQQSEIKTVQPPDPIISLSRNRRTPLAACTALAVLGCGMIPTAPSGLEPTHCLR